MVSVKMTEEQIQQLYKAMKDIIKTAQEIEDKATRFAAVGGSIMSITLGVFKNNVERLGILDMVRFELMKEMIKNE